MSDVCSKSTLIPVFLSALVAAAVAAGVSAPMRPTEGAATVVATQESAYARIMRTKTIRCGYSIYQPAFMRDANTGAFSGIMYDVTAALAAQMDLKVEYVEEVSYADMAAGLAASRYDMICSGKWVYAPQAGAADFSNTIFVTPLYAYGRADDTRFDADLSKLNAPEYAIATMDGTITTRISQTQFPLAKEVALPAMSSEALMIMNVVNGKADATFVDTAVANDFLANNPGKIRPITPGHPQTVFETTYMFPGNEPQLAAFLNASVRQLVADGTIDRLIAKYEKVPGTFLRPALPYKAP